MRSKLGKFSWRAAGILPVAMALAVGTAHATAINDPPPSGAILDLSGQMINHGKPVSESVDFNAALTSTAITFAFRDDPAYIAFGDVSLVDMTTGSSVNLLTNGDFSGGSYQDSSGQLAPLGWTYANHYGATFSGQMSGSPFACAGFSSGNCWYDGSMMACDALSQNVSTTAGNTYQLSFLYTENSHQSLFSDLATNGLGGRAGNGIDILAFAPAGLPPGSGSGTGTALPEPSTLVLFGAGLLGLAVFLRRRAQALI
ncbi:MAG: PEP-CTERM sorting domain-containing protein [Steroidobacteraceae bacterium]